jgi:hypothetical protein
MAATREEGGRHRTFPLWGGSWCYTGQVLRNDWAPLGVPDGQAKLL